MYQKIDRLMVELNLPPAYAYDKLRYTTDQANPFALTDETIVSPYCTFTVLEATVRCLMSYLWPCHPATFHSPFSASVS